jgi:hypothetical protein
MGMQMIIPRAIDLEATVVRFCGNAFRGKIGLSDLAEYRKSTDTVFLGATAKLS